MKTLIAQMKPFWKIIVIILIAHLVQAMTTLKLPEYTSDLVDTGIQNKGIEYAVPLSLNPQSKAELEIFMTAEEKNLLEANYYQDQQGNFTLNTAVYQDETVLQDLNNKFEVPVAMLQTFQNLSEEEAKRFSSLGEDLPAKEQMQEMRKAFILQMETMGNQMIHNTAIQGVIANYELTGGLLNNTQMKYLFSQGGMMLLIALLAFLSGSTATYLAAKVGAKVGRNLRSDIFSKVLQFSNQEMSHFSTASLITRSSNDIQQVQLIITILLRIILLSPMLAIGGLFYVVTTQSALIWITGLAILLIFLIMGVLMKITAPRFPILQKQVDRVNLYAREILTGLQVIRAFGRQEHETERFDMANQDLKGSFLYIGRIMALMMPLVMLLANGISILIVWFGGQRISLGTMQVGEMMAFITYNMQVIFSFLMITMMSIQIPRALVSSNRIQEVLDMPLVIEDPTQPHRLDQVKGEIAFNNVSFKFAGAENNTLQNINFTARPGETTAIIGATGSGKSTILNLIMRFYDATEGSVTIDGVDVRELSQKQLREIIGLVPQEGILFSGTIESNIGYGVAHLDQERRDRAAEIAHATEFILTKEKQFADRIAQGGSNISGGQKQRLSIARALAKEPQILLFDDSFSALDYRTDASLRQALHREVSEATVIIVAQRISTILDAEQIIVLDEGEIKGIGHHVELMETNEIYREIASSQLSQAELDKEAAKYYAKQASKEEK